MLSSEKFLLLATTLLALSDVIWTRPTLEFILIGRNMRSNYIEYQRKTVKHIEECFMSCQHDDYCNSVIIKPKTVSLDYFGFKECQFYDRYFKEEDLIEDGSIVNEIYVVNY
uniref:Apple domain-containing protein n=1 Tax=Clytia hemisphaerica TaxID=252671 RepID=A0A7M5XMA5_9CNID|eukprot:TCONS_00063639-protein